MRFFYDTEFHDNRRTIDLISLGMVCYETKDEFYAVSREFDTVAVAAEPWLMENVMSSIDHVEETASGFDGRPVKSFRVTDKHAKSRVQIRDSLKAYVEMQYFATNRDIRHEPPEFFHWYGAYDWVCLSQLFGKMIELPPLWPNFGIDIKQMHREIGYAALPKQEAGNHNALADAKFNVVRYNAIMHDLRERRANGTRDSKV